MLCLWNRYFHVIVRIGAINKGLAIARLGQVALQAKYLSTAKVAWMQNFHTFKSLVSYYGIKVWRLNTSIFLYLIIIIKWFGFSSRPMASMPKYINTEYMFEISEGIICLNIKWKPSPGICWHRWFLNTELPKAASGLVQWITAHWRQSF